MKVYLVVLAFLSLASVQGFAQQRLVTGSILNVSDRQPIPGVNILVKGIPGLGTVSDTNGNFSILVPSGRDTLIFSHVSYSTLEENIGARENVSIELVANFVALNEVVVIGYGTQLKKTLTGSIASVQEKEFNRGNLVAPDQLIQGRVAGLHITSSNGIPGSRNTIRIRGSSAVSGGGQPLFVVDGVPLSGSSARPDVQDFTGSTPAGNPLNFINPADVASIEVLKDASATAIYGSRGAYGVIIINTKKGQSGSPRLDASFSTGVASVFRKLEVLDAGQYPKALEYYGVTPSYNRGSQSDAVGALLRTGVQQNYNVALSGGNENGSYRFSFGYFDQEGIMKKSSLTRWSSDVSATLKLLQSKRLGIDIHLIPSQYSETVPPIRDEGSVLNRSLSWNPTDSLWNSDGTYKGQPGQNPVAILELNNDHSKVTTILASVSPHYDFTDWLTMSLLFNVTYGTGSRRMSTDEKLDNIFGRGRAGIYNTETLTKQMTSTLNFHKEIASGLDLNAVIGYEYMNFEKEGSSMSAIGPESGFGSFGLDYTDYIAYSSSQNRVVASFVNPSTELQSYFGRAVFNYDDRYFLTTSLRVDGSSKFGDNNKYGYFPSFSAAWNLVGEKFFRPDFVDALKLRIGWGKTGNQEFPAGSARALYGFSNDGQVNQINNPNPNLKWQSDSQFDVGIDFKLFHNRLSGTLDYFNKVTTDLLFPNYPIQPAPAGVTVTWMNLDGRIRNSGLELSLLTTIISNKDFTWDLGLNATFIRNNVSDLVDESGQPLEIMTGYLSGGGMSNVMVQVIKNGSPMNTFHTKKFLGIDGDTGMAKYEDEGYTFYDIGSPNPKTILGINTTLRFKKISVAANLYGAFGHYIYNNLLNNTVNVGNLLAGGNIALSNYESPVKESVYNPVTPSSRFIERGDYLKLGNLTLAYDIGSIGKAFKQTRIYVTGQNLFSITNYSGFDAEVDINRSVNSVPSFGIDGQVYPTARTLMIGLNFSL